MSEKHQRYATDFFSVNQWMLRRAGLWRPSTKNQYYQFCYTLYAISVFIFVNSWFTSTEFISLFYTYKDKYALIKNVNFFLTHFMGAIKVVFWYFRGQYLMVIMQDLEDPNYHYESYKVIICMMVVCGWSSQTTFCGDIALHM